MSSRIIRGDRRDRSEGQRCIWKYHRRHIARALLDVEKQAFEQGYAEGERIGKQMGEAMVETI